MGLQMPPRLECLPHVDPRVAYSEPLIRLVRLPWVRDAKRRKFDVLLIWKLDRLGRSLRHLLFLIDELQTVGVGLVSLGESLDTTTPAGRLQVHVLAAVSQFERDRLRERVLAGLQRAKRASSLDPRRRIDAQRLATVAGLPTREAARRLGVPRSTLQRLLAQNPPNQSPNFGQKMTISRYPAGGPQSLVFWLRSRDDLRAILNAS